MSRPSTPKRARRRARLAGAAVLAAVLGALAFLAALAGGEVTQSGALRVSVEGRLRPTKLPRDGYAPVAVTIGGAISTSDPAGPPQLRQMTIEINRHGRLLRKGLALCRLGRINPSTTAEARAQCGPSLIGEGHFSANVKLPAQSPFPSSGKILAFNGKMSGKPVIFAHIYGTNPVPTSYVLPFGISSGKGTFGTVLKAFFPRVTGDWGFVTGVSMTLGKVRTYIESGCPAASGFRSALFPLARTSFSFADGEVLATTLTRKCEVL